MIIKKIAALSASLILLITSSVYGSDIYTVYDLSDEARLSTGITYEHIEKYTSIGWLNINVVRADLTDKYTKIDPVTNSEGSSKKAPLSSMLQSSSAVVGVNGDFFLTGSDPTYSYGAIIKDEQLITSPLPYSYGYPTVSRLVDGAINISLWNPKITLFGTDGTTFDVVIYNKTSSLDWGPTILTSDWNKMSPGYSGEKDIVEVVIVNSVVKEVRKNMPSTIIPQEGYVISSYNATTMEQLTKSFEPGKNISLDIELDFRPNEVEWAFGGLNYLLKDGQLNDVSDEVLGTHPRTAIGFNEDNAEIILVTIDGRNKDYVGLKQTELAQIMTDLGAYNAVNMDGGGSTTMGVDFLRNSNIKVVNIPSDGRERNLASGVGVFNTAPDSNKVGSIEISADYNKVFNNTELNLNLKFYNEYLTQIDGSNEKVTYKVSPLTAGTVENNVFKPKKPGIATITAMSGEGEGEIEIEVLDSPVALKFNADKLTLDYGETYDLSNIIGIDENGNSAVIASKYIKYSYRNKVGKVEDGIFTAGDVNNTGAITATFGNAVKNIQVKVGYRFKTLNRFEDLSNLQFSLYPEESDGNIEITQKYVKEGSNALKINYDFTKMTDQSIAFINFGLDGNGIKLEGKPKAIGMWVYGDGKNHWLRTRITDVYGNEIKITFEDEVNWTGWKWVTAQIPEGIAYPITLKNIYLAEINETRKDAGAIYIDNLRLMYEPNDKNLGLREDTEFVDSLKISKINNFLEKLIVDPNKKEIVDDKGNALNKSDIISVDASINNGSLSATNTAMWENIKNLVNYKNKVLVLNMNNSIYSIYDEREEEILKNILKDAVKNNEVFVIWNEREENTFIEDGIRYITYDDSFELGITENGTFYKN